MKTVGIIGVGEVGGAIKKLAKNHFTVFERDVSYNQITGHVDVLHLCLPFSNQFTKVAIKAIKETTPKLVIINATVKVGTTREIYNKTKVPIAHTPIMGVHPHLARYQKTFTKIIGAINETSYHLAYTHWKILGAPKVIRFTKPENSELGKLLETTYYGWNIVFNKHIKDLCDTTKSDFDEVYGAFNNIYNQGYSKTKPNVRRPVLEFAPGPIGGHCVVPNAQILYDEYHKDWLKQILAFNKVVAKK